MPTYFRIPLCISLAFEGREDKNNLRKDTIFPRFLATKEKKEIKLLILLDTLFPRFFLNIRRYGSTVGESCYAWCTVKLWCFNSLRCTRKITVQRGQITFQVIWISSMRVGRTWQRDRQTGKQKDRQTNKKTDRHKWRCAPFERKTDRKMVKQTADRPTDWQTDRQQKCLQQVSNTTSMHTNLASYVRMPCGVTAMRDRPFYHWWLQHTD